VIAESTLSVMPELRKVLCVGVHFIFYLPVCNCLPESEYIYTKAGVIPRPYNFLTRRAMQLAINYSLGISSNWAWILYDLRFFLTRVNIYVIL